MPCSNRHKPRGPILPWQLEQQMESFATYRIDPADFWANMRRQAISSYFALAASLPLDASDDESAIVESYRETIRLWTQVT